MKFISTDIPDVLIIEPKVFGDERGFFMESFNQKLFDDVMGHHIDFVQDNHSRSSQGVLRGLHYQVEQAQGKLVRAISGSIFDVAVDLRRGSPTLGRWNGVELSGENRRQLWIPPGFAHGFLVLSESADVLYKATDFYAPVHERSIAWNDPDIGIQWPDIGGAPILSAKDLAGLSLANAQLYESIAVVTRPS